MPIVVLSKRTIRVLCSGSSSLTDVRRRLMKHGRDQNASAYSQQKSIAGMFVGPRGTLAELDHWKSWKSWES